MSLIFLKVLPKQAGRAPWSWSHITLAKLVLKRSVTLRIFNSRNASLVDSLKSSPATTRIALFWLRIILFRMEKSAFPHKQMPYVKCDWKIAKYKDNKICLLQFSRRSLTNGSIKFFTKLKNVKFPSELVVQNDTKISNFGAFKIFCSI